MPIETQCPGCQRTLSVEDQHAGKKARCPLCNTIYEVPLELLEQDFDAKILRAMDLPETEIDLNDWRKMVNTYIHPDKY